MNQMAISSTLPQISPPDRAALVDARNSLVGNEVTRPLSEPVKERLRSFLLSTVSLADARCSAAEIETEVGLLMFAFTAARTVSKDEAAIRIHEYGEVLREFPLWAIREGFRRIKGGEVEGVNPDFPPSAPRLKLVVADVMRPLLADRYEVKRILNARVAALENCQMADRVQRLTKAELLQKYGPDFGLGGVPPANEAHRVNDLPGVKQRQVMTSEELVEHYRTRGLGRVPKPVKRNDDRYGDRYDGVTSPDDVIDESGAA